MFIKDNFSNEEKYKLYRNIYEIIHPSISKKNISSYKIILDDNCLPVRVFYPKKVSTIDSVIIYVPGNGNVTGCYGKYDEIFSDMALKLDRLIICIDYFETGQKYPFLFDKVYDTIDFLLKEILKNGIDPKKVCLMGDSFGGNLISGISLKRCRDNLNSKYNEVLLYPLVSGEYFGNSKFESINNEGNEYLLESISSSFKKYISNKKRLTDELVCPLRSKDFSLYPDTLIVTGDLDVVRDENYAFYEKLVKYNEKCKHMNIEFLEHGFLNDIEDEIKDWIYEQIKVFIQ